MQNLIFKTVSTCLSFFYLQLKPTAYYLCDFISEVDEKALLTNVYAAPKPKWTQLSHRRLQNWGGIPHQRGMIAESLPPWLDGLTGRVHALRMMGGRTPNHVLVNEYCCGQGIMPHVDGDLFHPTIATISTGSHTVLKFVEPAGGGEDKTGGGDSPGSLLLEPRSLLLLQDSLYTHYLHCIEELTEDILDDSIVNLDLCSNKYVKGSTVSRGTRVSFTIRHVPKTSSFKINIGNK